MLKLGGRHKLPSEVVQNSFLTWVTTSGSEQVVFSQQKQRESIWMVSDIWGGDVWRQWSSPQVTAFQNKCPQAQGACGAHWGHWLHVETTGAWSRFMQCTCRAVQCPVPGPGRSCHCRWGLAEAALPSCHQSGSPRLLNGAGTPSSHSTWAGICLCNPLLSFFVLLPIHTKAALFSEKVICGNSYSLQHLQIL